MARRFLLLVATACALGLLFTRLPELGTAQAEEVPRELRAAPRAPSSSARDLSRPFIDATKRVRPAVVKIYNMRRWGNQLRPVSSGSGAIISERGHILTNRHVVLDAAQLLVKLHDGRTFSKIKKLGEDPRSDVAVLRILDEPADPLPVAKLGDSDELEVGEWVIAIGAPFQLESSVSVGVVSATGRTGVLRGGQTEEFIQTDAALNPGNSGGPLINLDGQIVGVNTAIQTGGRSQSSAGVGFAIPINLARTIAIALIKKGVAKRGWLGINVEQDRRGAPLLYSRDDLARRGIKGQSALRIEAVQKNSPAARAGLKNGDYITAVDGRPLRDIRTLHARLATAGPGGKLRITVDGRRETMVTLGEERIFSYGIEVADLDEAKARQLGVPATTHGVVVTRVLADSVAARADLRNRLMPGDVITRIAWPNRDKVITSKRDFEQLMALLQAEPPRIIRFFFRTKEGEYKADLMP